MANLQGTDNYQEIEIEDTLSIIDLLATLQSVFNIPWDEMELSISGREVKNTSAPISKINITNDILSVKKVPKKSPMNNNLGDIFSNFIKNAPKNPNVPSKRSDIRGYNPFSSIIGGFRKNQKEIYIERRLKEVKERFLTSPEDLDKLFKENPKLAEAIVAGDDNYVTQYIREKVEKHEQEAKDKEVEYIRLLNSDQNDPEVQNKIAKIIQQKNIDENLRQAEEYMPETLFPVHMLYINIEINKKKVVALVDTGAQSTVMSKNLCYKYDLMNLCDERYSGIAAGVGTSRIIGTVHAALMKVENKVLMAKITVIENNAVGFIFGLDNMRCHRCTINLAKNGLEFPALGVVAPFLSDGEIKKIKMEEEEMKEKEIEKAKQESLKQN